MQKFIQTVGIVIASYLAFDVVCFFAWGMSGQYPVAHFYFGVITKTVLQFIFF